jgi:hypothetical protein
MEGCMAAREFAIVPSELVTMSAVHSSLTCPQNLEIIRMEELIAQLNTLENRGELNENKIPLVGKTLHLITLNYNRFEFG